MWTASWNQLFEEKPIPQAGMLLRGDEWPEYQWHPLIAGDELDKQIFDTDLRYLVQHGPIESLAVKVELTGKMVYVHREIWKMRCRIQTWVDDDTPNEPFYGWLMVKQGWV